MNSFFLIVILLMLFNIYFSDFAQAKGTAAKWIPNFPKVKQIPKTWSFKSTNGNVSYTEDYYWMENANDTDKDLSKFIDDQSALTKTYMDQCKKDEIEKLLREAKDFNDFDSLSLWGEPNAPIYTFRFTQPGVQDLIWYLATPEEFEAGTKVNFNPPPGKPFTPLDMFQFELRSPNGFANEVEFGNISDPKEISSVFAYSPYQNIDSNKPYPATLLIVGQNDDTVSPSQAYKYLAKLQNTHPMSTMPFLLYDMAGAGHLDSDNGEDLLIQEGVHAFCLASQSLGFKRSTN